MKRYLLPIILLVLLMPSACKEKTPVTAELQPPQFNNQLTAEEKAGGVMTPEIMWKFGRLGSFTLSPDGSTVLFTVTDIDLQSEARRTNIFKYPLKRRRSRSDYNRRWKFTSVVQQRKIDSLYE